MAYISKLAQATHQKNLMIRSVNNASFQMIVIN